MARIGWIGISAVLGLALTSGCGPNCTQACRYVFSEDQCGLKQPGITADDLISNCITECEGALAQTGEMGGYDPNTPLSGETKVLTNDKQAAAWMDCVMQTSCERYCDVEDCDPIPFEEGVCPGGGI